MITVARSFLALMMLAFTLLASPTVARGTEQTEQQPGKPRVAMIGVPGLRWSDISPDETPNLWGLAQKSAMGSLVVRAIPSTTCPIPGWLTVSAGQPATGGPYGCDMPPRPQRIGDRARIVGIDTLREANQETSYAATVGWLGEEVRKSGGKTAAIGAGGALVAMDRTGEMDFYSRDIASAGSLDESSLIGISVDDIARLWTVRPRPWGVRKIDEDNHDAVSDAANDDETEAGDQRIQVVTNEDQRNVVRSADRKIGEILASLPSRTTIILAGLADAPQESHLHTLMVAGPSYEGEWGHRFLASQSTRQRSFVTIPDISATIASILELSPPPAGRPVTAPPSGVSDTHSMVSALVDDDMAAVTQREVAGKFLNNYRNGVMVALGLLALLAWLGQPHRRRVVAAVITFGGIAVGVSPLVTILTQLVPWWRASDPVIAYWAIFTTGVVALASLIATVALRRAVYGVLGVGIAAFAVLTFDVLIGSFLQLGGPTGYSVLSGARYFGFGNIGFAVYATGSLLLMAGVVHILRPRWPRAAISVALGIGLSAVAVDVAPWWGADFGGVLAFLPAVVLFTLLAAGRSISIGRIAVVGAFAAFLAILVSFVDWLRPAEQRTHLGAFFQQILDGSAWLVIDRKLSWMLNSFNNVNRVMLVVSCCLFIAFLLSYQLKGNTSLARRATERMPELRYAAATAALCAFVGMLLNDSGLAILAFALVTFVPLVAVAGVAAAPAPATPRPPRQLLRNPPLSTTQRTFE